jgi:hypothetical protein
MMFNRYLVFVIAGLPSVSLAALRGSVTTPLGPNQRKLQGNWLFDQTCYDENANACQCLEIKGHCNNVPACAASAQDAYNFAHTFCNAFTIWNNQEPDCQWQYMCCDNP